FEGLSMIPPSKEMTQELLAFYAPRKFIPNMIRKPKVFPYIKEENSYDYGIFRVIK
ncbi:MAG: hypothetical protein MHPSP_001496, partial [Paramarteilia canceri]